MKPSSKTWRGRIALAPESLGFRPAVLLGYVVQGRLDPQRVRTSLEAVVRRWPLLGARIVPDAESPAKYVFAVPQEWSHRDPLFNFSSADDPAALADLYPHALPSRRAGLTVSDLPPWNLRAGLFSPGLKHAWDFAGMVKANTKGKGESCGLMYLHVRTFADGYTAVGLRVTHAAFDGGGFAMVLREWESAMRDPEAYAKLPEYGLPPGCDKGVVDPTACLLTGSEPGERPRGVSAIGLMPFLGVIAKAQWRAWRRKYVRRTLHIPKETMQLLVKSVSKRVAELRPDAFVSTGDVLSALIWKCCLVDDKSSAVTEFIQALNLRPLFPELSVERPYMGPVTGQVFAFSTAGELKSSSLAEVSLQMRDVIKASNTRDNISGLLNWCAGMSKRGKNVALIDSTTVRFAGISNRMKLGLGNIDFSGAALDGKAQCIDSFIDRPRTSILIEDAAADPTPQGHINLTLAASRHAWEEMMKTLSSAKDAA